MAKHSAPKRNSLPAPQVRDFRQLLDEALDATDEKGRKWADAQWGCYAFYDYDDEPIYVGQTNERLRTRVRRHLTNQRTDAVAMRILDVFEVAKIELWPLWEFEKVAGVGKETKEALAAKKKQLDAVEYTAYLKAIKKSKFGAILNEKIPPLSEAVTLPASQEFLLISEDTRRERGHADIRIARRAETISRLAAVAHERGEVSDGLRRVLVVQAARLAYLAASRLAFVEGRPEPAAAAIDVEALVGTLLKEHRVQPSLEEDSEEPETD